MRYPHVQLGRMPDNWEISHPPLNMIAHTDRLAALPAHWIDGDRSVKQMRDVVSDRGIGDGDSKLDGGSRWCQRADWR